jgi:hypothetical protein
MDVAEVLHLFLERGPRWVTAQRESHRPAGHPVGPHDHDVLGLFFPDEILDAVRIVAVPAVPNPDFYDTLTQHGVPIPHDFGEMAGITFVDTILLSHARPVDPADRLPTLFHELVHAVQYAHLGVEEFVHRYVMGWAENGFRYEDIPLERDARELEARFRAKPATPFAVVAAVAAQLGPGAETA